MTGERRSGNPGSRRVLVIGADGLRPDLFDPATMPHVAALEASGTRFADHHAAYPSHTRVNMSTLTTGASPGRHGIVANTMLVDGATPDHIIDTSNYQHLDALDAFTDGRALLVPSLGDILARQGDRVAVAGTGSGGSNLLWTRNDRARLVNTNSAFGLADLYDLREKLGEIPEVGWPQIERTRYATRAVPEIFLDDPRNRVVVVWFSEPDASLHRFGLGAPETTAAMRGVDDGVGEMVAALERTGIRDQFDIFFVSDHGHSTVQAHNTLRDYLVQAAADLGGLPPLATASDYIYARPGTPEPRANQLAPLVDWLYAQPWCDVIFSGLEGYDALPGVLSLSDLWNGQLNDRRPLLAISPRWTDEANAFGVPGTVASLTTQAALKSSHGSLSPFDMHALMIANGPSFREGHMSEVPTGATDLAPTVLTLLDLAGPDPVDGRVLREAFRIEGDIPGPVRDEILEPVAGAPRKDQPGVRLHHVGTTSYVHGSVHR